MSYTGSPFSGNSDYENTGTYFADDNSDNTVHYLSRKSQEWFHNTRLNGYLEKIRRSWSAYHGSYYELAHDIGYGGEQGELVDLAINHYRNIGQLMLIMVTSTRPSFKARAINTDRKSLVQASLATGILDYYLREKRLERELKRATEYAIVLGSGFIKMEWNSTKGLIYDYLEIDEDKIEKYDDEGNPLDKDGNELKRIPIYEGDVEFKTLSPYDVVFDSTKETPEQHDWVLCRTFINKYDLIAKYPEKKEQILNVQTKDAMQSNMVAISSYDNTTDVPVYEFFHKRTEAIPGGRHLLYLEHDLVLSDGPMPYRDLPIFRIAPSDMLGTPYGYTTLWDTLPIQDAINSLYSTIMTNQNAFGVQNILNPRGNDIKVNQLEGSLNFIEYNAQAGKPEPLSLTNTPGEVFNFLQMLERAMETVSAMNSVVRGNPEKSLDSGNALALVQSQAIQFMSGLQGSYIQLLEDVGTGLINLLRDFAKVPRIAAIMGINNRTRMKEFTGDDLSTINRVHVDVGNSLSQCLAKDTPVMMSDGSLKMVQDIKIGEKVMGPDSNPRTVGNINSGNEEMFDITSKDPNRNIKYTCNKSHILTLRYCSDDDRYGAKKGDIIDVSVKDYLELPERHKRLLQGFTTGVEFDEKEVIVPSYILGLWLGDGSSASTALTTMDNELYLEWSQYAYSIGMQIRAEETNNKSTTYYITSGLSHGCTKRNPMMNEFRSMEVIKNKHIPEIYLKNSRKNRLELLAGLIDSDGTLVDQTFVFTQKCKRLTDQVEYLAKSLGFKVTKRYIEREYNNKEANIYRVNIGGDTWNIPTRLPRKQAKKVEKRKNWNNYGINVNSIGEGTYYGFTLVEEPHFLLGDFTVTHNTAAGRVQMAEQLLQMGAIKSPEKYLQVINTGNFDTLVEGELNELDTVKDENESLILNESVIAIATDEHDLHIREHKAVIADPEVRRSNPELVARTTAHIMEHIRLLRETDPELLARLGQQPAGPPMGSPTGPAQPGQMPASVDGASDALMNPDMQEQLGLQDQLSDLPQPARPAGDPTQPTTPEENLVRLGV